MEVEPPSTETARLLGHSSPAPFGKPRRRSRSPLTGRRSTHVSSTTSPRPRDTSSSSTRINTVEADHGRLKARLRPMRGLKTIRSLRTVAAGHAFVQNLRRGHYELTVDAPVHDRVRVAFTDLAPCL
jgi:hypothetical protein